MWFWCPRFKFSVVKVPSALMYCISLDSKSSVADLLNLSLPIILTVWKRFAFLGFAKWFFNLKDALFDDQVDYSDLIKKCEDFQKFTYDTFKTTLYNEGKKIKNRIK